MITSAYYSLYKTAFPKYWLIRDGSMQEDYSSSQEELAHKSLLFHVRQDDYLSTLATILGFFEEAIHDKNMESEMRELHIKIIKNVISDIMYLSQNYTLVKKDIKNKSISDE